MEHRHIQPMRQLELNEDKRSSGKVTSFRLGVMVGAGAVLALAALLFPWGGLP